jgi:aspartyl-tRNA(Asn)/glutamyl-tRNA(Gln) amidotransferase subunit C
MSITRDEVIAVASLARLRLSEAELDRFAVELNDILAHMAVLADVDAEGGDEGSVVVDWDAPVREDESGADPLARPLAELAPGWTDGFFTVPRLAALDTTALDDPFADKAAAGDAEGHGE